MISSGSGLRQAGILATLICAIAVNPSLTDKAHAQVAANVETGLNQLAQEIASKSTAADRRTISVLPFPHGDGMCSVLSTHIVDELTLSLFSVPGSPLTIIERARVESLISEMRVGEGGLLNPETTQELGRLSGAQALVLGTVTEIGDTVRINARLVATDTGAAVSAAAVTIPRTQAVSELMRRPLRKGVSCEATSVSPGTPPKPAMQPSDHRPPVGESAFEAEGIAISIASIARTSDGNELVLVLSVINNNETAVPVAFVYPAPGLISNTGNRLVATKSDGVPSCVSREKWQTSTRNCRKTISFVTLNPKVSQTARLVFRSEDVAKISGDEMGGYFSLSARLQMLVSEKELKEISISVPNISLPK